MVEVGVVGLALFVGVAIYLATRKRKEKKMSKDYKFIHNTKLTGRDWDTMVVSSPIEFTTITTHSIEGGENHVSTVYEAQTLGSNFEPSIVASYVPNGLTVTTKVMAVISDVLYNGIMVYEIKSMVNK